MKRLAFLPLMLAVALPAWTCAEDFKPVRLMPPKAPVKPQKIVSREEANQQIESQELVIGVRVGGAARAYPLNMIKGPSKELLNDTLGQREIAVTWCSLCYTSLVFDRKVKDNTLEFGVAGMLWQDNMVMYDKQTRSLWSQATGTCKHGRLKDTSLQRLDSQITDWQSWCREYPQTTAAIFDRTASANTSSNFEKSKHLFVLGLQDHDAARAWELKHLPANSVINDTWHGMDLAVVSQTAASATRAYVRNFGRVTLTFEFEDGKLQDQESGTTWNALTGKAIAGPLAGAQLRPAGATLAFRRKWEKLHPSSEYYKP